MRAATPAPTPAPHCHSRPPPLLTYGNPPPARQPPRPLAARMQPRRRLPYGAPTSFEAGGIFPALHNRPRAGQRLQRHRVHGSIALRRGTVGKFVMPKSAGASADEVSRRILDAGNVRWRSGDQYWYGVNLYSGDDWQPGDLRDDRQQLASIFSFRYVDGGSRKGTGSIELTSSSSGPRRTHTRAALSADEYSDGAGGDPCPGLGSSSRVGGSLICHSQRSHRSTGYSRRVGATTSIWDKAQRGT